MNQNKEMNIDDVEVLKLVLKRANIDLDDVLKDMKTMKKETILKRHKENFKVWMDVGKRNFQTVANTGNWLQKPHWRTLKST